MLHTKISSWLSFALICGLAQTQLNAKTPEAKTPAAELANASTAKAIGTNTAELANTKTLEVNATEAANAANAFESHVRAELIAENQSAEFNQAFWLALRIQMDEGWHTYWKHAGAIGTPTSLKWLQIPEGFKVEKFRWPAPKAYAQSGLINYVYEKEVLLLFKVTPKKNFKAKKTLRFEADVEWLECSDTTCVPGGTRVSLSLPISSKPPKPSHQKGKFDQSRRSWPKAPPENWQLTATRNAQGTQLQIQFPETPRQPAGKLYFFDASDSIEPSAPQILSQKNNIFKLQLQSKADAATQRLTGVLTAQNGLGKNKSIKAIRIDLPFTQAPPENLTIHPLDLLKLLLPAMLGGLILNLMPCVFPIIGIKIMGFVHQAGQSRRKIIQSGLVFTLGVLLSFWALAGALIILRLSGEHIGWGFQLQKPIFVLLLSHLIFIFALSLSGVFEVGYKLTSLGGTLSQKSGNTHALLSGMLATVLATPCAAPFLAPALGAALTLPPLHSLLVFTAIGLGLSLPYITLSIFPQAIGILPKPGPWMENFKQCMAFPLYATAAWLLWVLLGQIDPLHSLEILIGFVLMALACWLYGKNTQRPKKISRLRGQALAIAIAALCLGWGVQIINKDAEAQNPKNQNTILWENWSAARLAELRAQNKAVYIDFTARWCATCQVNKRVYKKAAVQRAFRELDITALKADWTRHDPNITKAINSFGRNAVPLNIYYPPSGEAIILPELLSTQKILKALKAPKAEP